MWPPNRTSGSCTSLQSRFTASLKPARIPLAYFDPALGFNYTEAMRLGVLAATGHYRSRLMSPRMPLNLLSPSMDPPRSHVSCAGNLLQQQSSGADWPLVRATWLSGVAFARSILVNQAQTIDCSGVAKAINRTPLSLTRLRLGVQWARVHGTSLWPNSRAMWSIWVESLQSRCMGHATAYESCHTDQLDD